MGGSSRARVKKDGKWGYIDRRGNEVIETKYNDAEAFCQGLALVKLRSDYYGFIDINDNIVIPFQFNYAQSFSKKKTAKVGKSIDGEFKYYAIDTQGYRVGEYHDNENFMIDDN